MNRDMIKTVESIKGKGIIPNAYDLTSTEAQTIYTMFQSDPYEAICTLFDYGFVLGSRAQKAGKLQQKVRPVSEEKAAYIERINREMLKCSDLGLLDLVYKLLAKSENTVK